MLFKYHYEYSYGSDGGANCPKSTVFSSLSGALLLKVWASEQQPGHPWADIRYRVTGPAPDMLNLNPCFHKIAGLFMSTLKVEKHWPSEARN